MLALLRGTELPFPPRVYNDSSLAVRNSGTSHTLNYGVYFNMVKPDGQRVVSRWKIVEVSMALRLKSLPWRNPKTSLVTLNFASTPPVSMFGASVLVNLWRQLESALRNWDKCKYDPENA